MPLQILAPKNRRRVRGNLIELFCQEKQQASPGISTEQAKAGASYSEGSSISELGPDSQPQLQTTANTLDTAT